MLKFHTVTHTRSPMQVSSCKICSVVKNYCSRQREILASDVDSESVVSHDYGKRRDLLCVHVCVCVCVCVCCHQKGRRHAKERKNIAGTEF